MLFANNPSRIMGQVAPTVPVRLDRNHWAAKAVGHAWLFNGRPGGVVDLITGTRGTYAQTPAAVNQMVTKYGPGYYNSSVADGIRTLQAADDCKQGNLAIVCGFSNYTPNQYGTSNLIIREPRGAYTYGSADPVWTIEYDTAAVYWDNGNAGGYQTQASGPGGGIGPAAFVQGRNNLNVVSVVDNGTTAGTKFWINNQLMTAFSGSTTLAFGTGASANDSIQLGNTYINDATLCTTACFHFLYVFKRALTDAERQSLYRDPYQMFVPANESARIYLASTTALTAVSGSGAGTISPFTGVATGAIRLAGSVAATIGPFPTTSVVSGGGFSSGFSSGFSTGTGQPQTVTTTGIVYPDGSGQSTVLPFTAAGAGNVFVQGAVGSAADTIARFSAAGAGVVGSAADNGSGAVTIARFQAAAQGVVGNLAVSATAAGTLAPFASGGYIVNLGAAVTFVGTDAIGGYVTSAAGSVSPGSGVAGNAADTVPPFVTATVGILGVSGSAVSARPRPPVGAAQGVYGTITVSGAAADSLGPFASTGTVVTIDGAVAATVQPFVSTATAIYGTIGTVSRTLPAPTTTTVGRVGVAGTAADGVPAFVSASPGSSVGASGNAITVVPAVRSTATGTTSANSVVGNVTVTGPLATAAAVGRLGNAGSGLPVVNPFTDAGAGTHGVAGSVARTSPAPTAAASGLLGIGGSAADTVSAFVGLGSGVHAIGGTAADTVGPFIATTFSASGAIGSAADVIAAPTATASGTSNPADGEAGNVGVTVDAFVASASAAVGNTGAAAAAFSGFVAAAVGNVIVNAAAADTIGPFTAAAVGTISLPGVVGQVASTIVVSASASGAVGIAGSAARTVGLWFGNGNGAFIPASTGGRATKVGSVLVTPQTCSAGSAINAVSGIINLTTAYDSTITARVVNGASAPAVGCTVELDISYDSATWRAYAKVPAGTTAGETYDYCFQLGDSVMFARLGFGGNTSSDVTVDGYAQVLTGV